MIRPVDAAGQRLNHLSSESGKCVMNARDQKASVVLTHRHRRISLGQTPSTMK
jgi:hypothetical protein